MRRALTCVFSAANMPHGGGSVAGRAQPLGRLAGCLPRSAQRGQGAVVALLAARSAQAVEGAGRVGGAAALCCAGSPADSPAPPSAQEQATPCQPSTGCARPVLCLTTAEESPCDSQDPRHQPRTPELNALAAGPGRVLPTPLTPPHPLTIPLTPPRTLTRPTEARTEAGQTRGPDDFPVLDHYMITALHARPHTTLTADATKRHGAQRIRRGRHQATMMSTSCTPTRP